MKCTFTNFKCDQTHSGFTTFIFFYRTDLDKNEHNIFIRINSAEELNGKNIANISNYIFPLVENYMIKYWTKKQSIPDNYIVIPENNYIYNRNDLPKKPKNWMDYDLILE